MNNNDQVTSENEFKWNELSHDFVIVGTVLLKPTESNDFQMSDRYDDFREYDMDEMEEVYKNIQMKGIRPNKVYENDDDDNNDDYDLREHIGNTKYYDLTWMCMTCGTKWQPVGRIYYDKTKNRPPLTENCLEKEKIHGKALSDVYGEEDSMSGKYVILGPKHFKPEIWFPTAKRVFLAGGGFGVKRGTVGNAVMGIWVHDGEDVRQERWQVTRLATEEEIAKAKAMYFEKHGTSFDKLLKK